MMLKTTVSPAHFGRRPLAPAFLQPRQSEQRERKRIARDLHDTVSQELFAATMIVSGLSQTIALLDKEQAEAQLATVESILENAQKDLRILLLHLRPTELEGKTLSEGFAMILTELRDKSDMDVTYQEDIQGLPKVIEDNLFRIAQEFISNSLKQTTNEVQLKMIDNGHEGVELALDMKPDVVVMDLVMPEMDGVEATLTLLKDWPEAKIVVLTSYLDNEKVYPVIQAGAKGYDNQTIADLSYISLKTVKTHVSNILAKLNVTDRTQAVVYAFQHQLVERED